MVRLTLSCLRCIFSHVFAAVRARFAERLVALPASLKLTSREMLHYKAIASFLFVSL